MGSSHHPVILTNDYEQNRSPRRTWEATPSPSPFPGPPPQPHKRARMRVHRGPGCVVSKPHLHLTFPDVRPNASDRHSAASVHSLKSPSPRNRRFLRHGITRTRTHQGACRRPSEIYRWPLELCCRPFKVQEIDPKVSKRFGQWIRHADERMQHRERGFEVWKRDKKAQAQAQGNDSESVDLSRSAFDLHRKRLPSDKKRVCCSDVKQHSPI